MRILYLHEFIRELEQLDKKAHRRIKEKLLELNRTPFDRHAPVALKGAQFKGLYKQRVGAPRLIYQIQARELIFVTLGHRSDVYKK